MSLEPIEDTVRHTLEKWVDFGKFKECGHFVGQKQCLSNAPVSMKSKASDLSVWPRVARNLVAKHFELEEMKDRKGPHCVPRQVDDDVIVFFPCIENMSKEEAWSFIFTYLSGLPVNDLEKCLVAKPETTVPQWHAS